MILVDTGYLLALAQPRDHLHERAVRWSARIDEPLIVTEYVLLELINALSAPVDRLRAHAMVTHLLSGVEFVRASAHLWDNGLSLHRQRLDKSWSLTDCISFGVMKERAISKALSHDIHFEQAGFVPLLRRQP